jgi:hypothetical protein
MHGIRISSNIHATFLSLVLFSLMYSILWAWLFFSFLHVCFIEVLCMTATFPSRFLISGTFILCLRQFSWFPDYMPALLLYCAWYFPYFCFIILQLFTPFLCTALPLSPQSISVLFHFCAWQSLSIIFQTLVLYSLSDNLFYVHDISFIFPW